MVLARELLFGSGAIRQAVAAFRAAVKRALKKNTKKGKNGAEEESSKTHVACIEIMALVKAASDGMQNVFRLDHLAPFNDQTVGLIRTPVEMSADLHKLQALKLHASWVQKQVLRADSTSRYGMAAYKPALAKQVTRLLKTHLPNYLCNIPLPADVAGLKDEIFAPQHWAMTGTHFQVAMNPYGVGEMRLLQSGAYIVAGVKAEDLVGDSMIAKMERLVLDAGAKEFAKLCKESGKGFFIQHDEEGSIVYIPSGYVVLSTGNAIIADGDDASGAPGAHGLRWGFLDATSPPKVAGCTAAVETMLKTYPELEGSDYKTWLDCLKQYMVAA